MDNARHYQAVVTGLRNKRTGEYWEKTIEAACEYYSQKGIAEIHKNPEPMRPLSRPNNKGQFLACFTKRAGADYIGVLQGGRFIAMEAKHTDTGRLQRNAVTDEQSKQLDAQNRLGADCYVLISFGFNNCYKVPWYVFRDMKQLYGRKYITPEDVKRYRVRYSAGILRFLG